jgi:hypothetical protein
MTADVFSGEHTPLACPLEKAKVRDGEDAIANTPAACAPQNYCG